MAPGQSFAEQRVQARDAMDRSERVAAAVALEAAGYPVRATATGVLVESVAPDVPAGSVLRTGDVIVRAGGKPVKTVAQLRAVLGRLAPGDSVALRVERNGTLVLLSALDNLGKGAAGQAVQCANLMLGLPETAGLLDAPHFP